MTLSRGHVLGVVLALLAAGGVLAFWPQEEPGVKEAITRKVVKMTDAAERKDMAELMAGVSDTFSSGEGWSKQDVKGVLLGQVLRGNWMRVFVRDLQVTEVNPSRGDVQVKIIFGRSEADQLEKLAQDSVLSAYLIEGTFEKQSDGEWRVVQAKHRPLSPTELF
ncbi:hypothetical protein [Vitiosangium sp. GDMCC 1.1324]|uniref:hypothetical protein n=1 Tax=Vitiosangium sp. (strain GDMCC 1.1324) TaxID=2138576 RepID=UPI000D38BCCB|nr:hypothetical protein [Vitiosangium sp. GDMCC 1.1324]PTL80413.1 hypothetical protein DAT35_27625 [Vitiosangium sp. GDMCC 1.1324]